MLDSVVPSWNVDPMQLVNMRQSAAVLRDVCAAQRCGFDPASDLAAVVRRYHDGPALLDMLVALSVGDPSFPGVPAALHAAAAALHAELPRIPVLLLAGGHDLSTPLESARAQAALAPDGRLFVVPTAGHSVQNRAAGDPAEAELARFLG